MPPEITFPPDREPNRSAGDLALARAEAATTLLERSLPVGAARAFSETLAICHRTPGIVERRIAPHVRAGRASALVACGRCLEAIEDFDHVARTAEDAALAAQAGRIAALLRALG